MQRHRVPPVDLGDRRAPVEPRGSGQQTDDVSSGTADSSIGSPLAIHRWELETLTIQLFLTPKQVIDAEANLVLDCSKFVAIRETVNRLRSLENVESAFYL